MYNVYQIFYALNKIDKNYVGDRICLTAIHYHVSLGLFFQGRIPHSSAQAQHLKRNYNIEGNFNIQ